jgi:hypothetical protein
MAIVDAQTEEGTENADVYPNGVILPKGSEIPKNIKPQSTVGIEVPTTKTEETEVECVPEHEPYVEGTSFKYVDLWRRVEVLENRFNLLIDRISKSKKVKDV